MASNLDYLNPNLQPLVEKVEAYLAAEKELQQLGIADRNEATHNADVAAAAAEFEQRPPTGSFDQHADELALKQEDAQDAVARLRQDIIGLLPTRNEWVKVNLGYGPSRVGAWSVPSPDGSGAEHYEVRVVF